MSVIKDTTTDETSESQATKSKSVLRSIISSNEGIPRGRATLTANQKELGEKNYRRMTYGATNASYGTSGTEDEEALELRHHLEQSQPFNGKWHLLEFINAGAYGSVIAVEYQGKGLEAVLKVSKGESANRQAEWESFILRRIQERNQNANVVRLLDSGTLANFDDDHLKFLTVEKCTLSIMQYLKNTKDEERQRKVCEVALGMLKALHDIHSLGILHRDIKSINAGLIRDDDGKIKVLLYDFGNARLYTDDVGELIPPRTTTPFRGSKEFSSNWADDMRDQTRWDDLISWFIVAIDLMNPNEHEPENPLPWTRANSLHHQRAMTFLKGAFMPTNVLLRHCPQPFYAIHSYLHTAPRHTTPDYEWLAKKVREAMVAPKP